MTQTSPTRTHIAGAPPHHITTTRTYVTGSPTPQQQKTHYIHHKFPTRAHITRAPHHNSPKHHTLIVLKHTRPHKKNTQCQSSITPPQQQQQHRFFLHCRVKNTQTGPRITIAPPHHNTPSKNTYIITREPPSNNYKTRTHLIRAPPHDNNPARARHM